VERAGFLATASTPAARRAMAEYVRQVDQNGDAPVSDPAAYRPWQDGTATEMNS
jgi:hypothetical protein